MSVENRPQNIIRGVALIVLAALTISVQDVIFKVLSGELTLWQIFALRGVLAVPLLLTISWMRGAHQKVLRAAFSRGPLLRALFITKTFLAFYAAIPFLSLSTVGAANYIAPGLPWKKWSDFRVRIEALFLGRRTWRDRGLRRNRLSRSCVRWRCLSGEALRLSRPAARSGSPSKRCTGGAARTGA